MCHGTNAISGGSISDLRYAEAATYDAMDRIVREGAYQALGMPKFDFLTAEELNAVRSYLLSRRQALIDGA